jgi:hypothetical protein
MSLVLVMSAVVAVGCDETREDFYPGMAAAAQMVDRGWIPDCLPAQTNDIRVRTNIDTSNSYGAFAFPAAAAEAVRTALAPASEVPSLPAGRPGPPSWWPAALSEELTGTSLGAHGYALFQCSSRRPFAIAVNWADRQGYFWSTR